MSVHSDKAYSLAHRKGAAAAQSYQLWGRLTGMSKRQLAEIVCHLAALSTESYDATISDPEALWQRIVSERDALSDNGCI